jgi:hypothetical protein
MRSSSRNPPHVVEIGRMAEAGIRRVPDQTLDEVGGNGLGGVDAGIFHAVTQPLQGGSDELEPVARGLFFSTPFS